MEQKLQLDFGILDCKHLYSTQLISSNSNASLSIFNSCSIESIPAFSLELGIHGSVQMSLDYCLSGKKIATCNDLGYVHMLNVDGIVTDIFRAHDAECWSVSFVNGNEATCITSSDDSSFKLWGFRVGLEVPVYKNKFHEYGVCSINWNPHCSTQFISGSYDNSFAIWDIRNLSNSQHTPLRHEVLAGGVWKINWHPELSNILTIACMYAGSTLFDLETGICTQFDSPNPSISYGGLFLNSNDLVTCSFYDKKITLWKCR